MNPGEAFDDPAPVDGKTDLAGALANDLDGDTGGVGDALCGVPKVLPIR